MTAHVTEVMHRAALLAERYRRDEIERLRLQAPIQARRMPKTLCRWCKRRGCIEHDDLNALLADYYNPQESE